MEGVFWATEYVVEIERTYDGAGVWTRLGLGLRVGLTLLADVAGWFEYGLIMDSSIKLEC